MVVEPNVGLEITKGVGIDSIAVNNETAMHCNSLMLSRSARWWYRSCTEYWSWCAGEL